MIGMCFGIPIIFLRVAPGMFPKEICALHVPNAPRKALIRRHLRMTVQKKEPIR